MGVLRRHLGAFLEMEKDLQSLKDEFHDSSKTLVTTTKSIVGKF